MRLVKNVTALHTSKKRKLLRRYLHYKGITRACSTLGIRTRLRAAYPYLLCGFNLHALFLFYALHHDHRLQL